MKYLLSIFLSLFIFSAYTKNKCSKDDHKWAKSDCKEYDICYNPEKMYQLGLDIQEALRNKDIEKLYSFSGSKSGFPRKKKILEKGFDAAFEEGVVEDILNDIPPCTPRKEDWFFMGGGRGIVKMNSDYEIISITSNDIEDYEKKVEWIHNKNIISPNCFTHIWISDDNYQAYEEKFNIKDTNDFRSYPGRYFGSQVSLEAIDSPWGKGKIYLTKDLKTCNSYKTDSNTSIEIKDSHLQISTINEEGEKIGSSYRVLKKVSLENCEKFAPNIKGKCISSYLIRFSPNSINSNYSPYEYGVNYYYIYGIFNTDKNKTYMVPLVNKYGSKNYALDFIDELEEKSQ